MILKSEQVRLGRGLFIPINVDAPKLANPVYWIIDGIEVLREASRRDQIINLPMFRNNISNYCFD